MTIFTINSSTQHSVNNTGIETSLHPDNTMILLDKFKVEADYFDIVKANFNDIHPFLLEGVDYSAEDLVGAELWTDLTGFAQRHAHLCLKHMATLPGAHLIDMSGMEIGKTDFQITNK